MATPCTICQHPERGAIDAILARQGGYRNTAQRYGVTPWALLRHEEKHLPAQLVKAAATEDVAGAIDAWKQLKAVNGVTLAILQEARQQGDGELALKAIARVEKQIELQARLLGELQDAPTVNIAIVPEWVSIRTAVFTALAGYPEARQAVAAALEDGNGHAG